MTIMRQMPSIVLPAVAPVGNETELIQNTVARYSKAFDCWALQEKLAEIFVVEVVGAAAAANLLCWIEIGSDGTNWTALATPAVIVGTGTNLNRQSIMLPWTAHSEYARLCVQMAAASAVNYWLAVGIFSGKY